MLLCTVDFLNAVKPTVVDGARRAIREATGVAEDMQVQYVNMLKEVQ